MTGVQTCALPIWAAKAANLPSIGLILGGGFSGDWLGIKGDILSSSDATSSTSSSGSFYDWGGVLTLRQPLYDGGQSRESSALAQRRADQGQVAIEQARQTITQNVQTWYASYQAAGPQIQAATAAAKAGDEAVRDALLRYRAGIAPLTELLLAQRNRQQASTAQAAAIHRWNLSRAGLELETGLTDPPPTCSRLNC